MRDRYGNPVTTKSPEAFDAYCRAVDLFLGAQAGAVEAFEQALALDPTFALAHADLARTLQIMAQPEAAKAHMQQALSCVDGLSASEQAHVDIMGLLLSGRGAEAFESIKQHLQQFPRDVLTLTPCCGVFGLIGFSGRAGREQENADFMASVASHYSGDWWFDSQYAFALCEIGELAQAERLNDAAFEQNPLNANAVHHAAHIHYETGERSEGRARLNGFRATYSKQAILHCHLAWHDALWALEDGDITGLWENVRTNVFPETSAAPPINVLTDLVAVLIRAELAGVEAPEDLWHVAADYARASFPRPGVSFADAHSAVAFARTGDTQSLNTLQTTTRGWAADQVSQLAKAFWLLSQARSQQDWLDCAAAFLPVLDEHERLGGSRAQRDLLEFAFAHTQHELQRPIDRKRAQRLQRVS